MSITFSVKQMAHELPLLVHAVLARSSSAEVTVLRLLLLNHLVANITVARDDLRSNFVGKLEYCIVALEVDCFLADVYFVLVISWNLSIYKILNLVCDTH
jgi:hypothetical protein